MRQPTSALALFCLVLGGSLTVAVADQPEAVRVADAQLWQALDLDRAGLAEVKEAVEAGDLTAAGKAWAAYFAAREKPTCHFDRETWAAHMRAEFPAVADAMLALAETIAAGEIRHGPASIPVEGMAPDGKIDWLHNPTEDTNYVSLVGSQWFLNPLGRAYLLTGDDKFAATFAWIFESWFDNQEAICKFQGGLGFNPVYRAYYPGIQSRVLVDNYYCLKDHPALTPELHVKIMRQLLALATFLERQERGYRIGNQQVAAVLGLGVIGLVFPEFRDAPKWVERAETLMAGHLHKDFYADGGHKELCTQYHKTCLRDICYVALTSEHNGRPSPLLRGENGEALERSFNWLSELVMPTGETPPLHSAVFSTDYAVYTLISATHFRRADHAWISSRYWQRGEAPNQKGPLAFGAYLLCPQLSTSALSGAKPPERLSTHLKESGFAIMRTGWEPDGRYLVFQYGWPNTGHAYPVALSFLLEMNGEVIATHAGSPRSYKHPAYRYCSSTMSHQTVSLDGKSYPKVKGLAPGGNLETLADLPGLWYASAHHEGYKSTLGAVHHRRLIVLKDGPILILDLIEGGAGHTAQWNFHTPLEATVNDDKSVTLAGKQTYRLVPARPDEVTRVKVRRHWAAVLPRDCQPEDCGAEVTGLAFEKVVGEDGARFAMALFEGQGQVVAEGDGVARLTLGPREYVVLSRANGSVAGDIQAEARLTVVERARGRPVRAWVVEGRRLVVGGVGRLVSATPTTRELDLTK